jgi:hypothetical protein
MTTKTFANFQTRHPILTGDFLVGYKEDASQEIKITVSSLIQKISSSVVSGNWDSVYSSVKYTSGNWDSTYTTVLTESASWIGGGGSDVVGLSANWESTYTTVESNSSTNWDNNLSNQYTHINFLPLSGGIISTNLFVSGDYFNSEALTVFGNISASGSVYSSGNLEINGGSNTTLYVEDGLVGINTETPNESLTVFGNISASGSVYGNSLSLEADVEQPVKFLKSSSTLSLNPGVDVGVLRWESGTNAGTLKLVAYAGTSTTGVTIIDNVGSGNT